MKRTIRAQADYSSVLLRNQLSSLVLYESITTTKAKASQLLPFANHFFNRVRSADLTAKKLAHQTLLDKNAIKKVFEDVLPRYQAAETTFIRTYRVLPRRGDSAEMVRLSLTAPLKAKTETPQPAAKTTNKDTKPQKTTKKS